MKNLTLFFLLSLSSTLFGDAFKINFAPLPTKKAAKNIEDFLPMSFYLESKLSIKVSYVYKEDYRDLLNGFKDGSIDMAYLGPLPYLSLRDEYEFVEPIIAFKQDDGLGKYRCVLAKFRDDKFDKESQIKVALTQPLSTCGYYMSSILLKEKFNINLNEQKYKYLMSHTNALTAVVKGDFLLAGASESLAKKYESLGIEIIAKSELLPGYSLVVNTKTLSKKQIQSIKDTLLELQSKESKDLRGILSNGVAKINKKELEKLDIDIDIPKKDSKK